MVIPYVLIQHLRFFMAVPTHAMIPIIEVRHVAFDLMWGTFITDRSIAPLADVFDLGEFE